MMTERDKQFFMGLVNQLCEDYAFHRTVANKIAMKAWKDYYDGSATYYRIAVRANEISDFVEDILWLEMGYNCNSCFDESKFEGSRAYKKFVESEK